MEQGLKNPKWAMICFQVFKYNSYKRNHIIRTISDGKPFNIAGKAENSE
jgi:hypothetical protein